LSGTGCLAFICITGSAGNELKVSQAYFKHNHEHTKSEFELNHRMRLPKGERREKINEILMQSIPNIHKRTLINDMFGLSLTLQDIANMIREVTTFKQYF